MILNKCMEIIDKIVSEFDLKIKYVSSFTNARSWENDKITLEDNGWGVIICKSKESGATFRTPNDIPNFEIHLIAVIRLLQS